VTRSSDVRVAVCLAALLAAPVASIAREIHCPPAQGSHRLSKVSVFDGPPSEQADLVPDTISRSGGRSRWELAYLFKLGRRVFVQCRYAPGDPAVVVEPGKAIRACTFATSGTGEKSLVCE
jgi:hypothetical protein